MTINHKLISLGLAFSLLGSTGVFARPAPHREHGSLSYEKKTAGRHVPTAKTSSTCARHPSANTAKDDWPAYMILG
jgi:hypothetical protein